MQFTRFIAFISMLALFSVAISPRAGQAQLPTDDEIQQAVEVMRAAGQSEETIDQFLQSMRGAQAFASNKATAEEDGLSEEDAARRAAGFTDSQMSEMSAMDNHLAEMNANIERQNLQRDIAAFNDMHGDKHDATVIIEGEVYSLKVIECKRDGETFSLYAEGEPKQHRRKGPSLNARRASAYGQGGFYESIHFKTSDFRDYGVGQQTGRFEGDKFIFDGTTDTPIVGEKTVSLSVRADCS